VQLIVCLRVTVYVCVCVRVCHIVCVCVCVGHGVCVFFDPSLQKMKTKICMPTGQWDFQEAWRVIFFMLLYVKSCSVHKWTS